jgi:hypothetical protein
MAQNDIYGVRNMLPALDFWLTEPSKYKFGEQKPVSVFIFVSVFSFILLVWRRRVEMENRV